jgi:hypothetical protein
LSTIKKWNAPPGQTTTPVPTAIDGSGKKTVSVGWLTLRTNRLFSDAVVRAPGRRRARGPHLAPDPATPG